MEYLPKLTELVSVFEVVGRDIKQYFRRERLVLALLKDLGRGGGCYCPVLYDSDHILCFEFVRYQIYKYTCRSSE